MINYHRVETSKISNIMTSIRTQNDPSLHLSILMLLRSINIIIYDRYSRKYYNDMCSHFCYILNMEILVKNTFKIVFKYRYNI